MKTISSLDIVRLVVVVVYSVAVVVLMWPFGSKLQQSARIV